MQPNPQLLAPMTPADVQSALDRLNTGIQIRFFDNSTATSQQAADNVGCELGQIVKSLAFIIDGKPIVVLASGDQRVDDRKLAEMYSVGRKKVKIASPEECVTIYGYAPGGVPPLPHRTPDMAIYMDDSLQRYAIVYAAGGAHNAIFEIPLVKLAEITGAKFADVARKE
ncbi:MAG: YbaK/EbsC family protein [Burkholderiales bacterium]|nr:YbaK/EbsC family protein [Anaerolineae bacterium]